MVYPNPQIFPHLAAIFVHIPKTAGTAIERTLQASPHQNVGGHTTALGYQRTFPEEFATFFKFGVIREPVSRFLSAWRYLRKMPVHPALNNATIHECTGLSDWMDRLRTEPKLLDRIVHFWPQWKFVCDESGDLMVDRLFRFERIEAEWREISAILGIQQAELPRINQSGDWTEGRTVFNDFEISWITRYYAKDFQLGEYGKD